MNIHVMIISLIIFAIDMAFVYGAWRAYDSGHTSAACLIMAVIIWGNLPKAA